MIVHPIRRRPIQPVIPSAKTEMQDTQTGMTGIREAIRIIQIRQMAEMEAMDLVMAMVVAGAMGRLAATEEMVGTQMVVTGEMVGAGEMPRVILVPEMADKAVVAKIAAAMVAAAVMQKTGVEVTVVAAEQPQVTQEAAMVVMVATLNMEAAALEVVGGLRKVKVAELMVEMAEMAIRPAVEVDEVKEIVAMVVTEEVGHLSLLQVQCSPLDMSISSGWKT